MKNPHVRAKVQVSLRALILALALLSPTLAPRACAADILSDELGARDVRGALPDEARGFVDGLSLERADLNRGISNLLGEAGSQAGGILRQSLSGILLILAVLVLCGVASQFLGDKHRDIVTMTGVLGIAAVAVGNVTGVLQTARQALIDLNAFAATLLPALATATAAMGKPVSGAAKHAATMFFVSAFVQLLEKLLFPMLLMHLALLTANTAMGSDALSRLAKLLKWLTAGILGLCLTAFVLYLTLGGAISGSADALAMKGAKTVISGAVPVVGSIISDAAETIMVGAGVIKNAVGLFGLFAMLGIVLSPFLQMGVRAILFKVAGALISPIADDRMSAYMDGLSGVFSLALAMIASASFLCVMSVVSFILSGA